MTRTVDFLDGGIALTVTANGKAIKARTYLYSTGSKDEVARESTKDGLADYQLEPGKYDILVRPDSIEAPDRRVEGIEVEFGKTSERTVDFSAGRVEVTITTNGKPLKARTYLQDAESKKEFARDGTNDKGVAEYNVPIGEYRLKVRPDGVTAPDQFIENVIVKAGETTSKALDFSSGRVEMTITTNGKPLKARTYLQFYESKKEAARDGTNDKGIVEYRVPVGEYRLKVRPDGIDASDRYLEDITVTAGKTVRPELDFADEE